jgi:hypothetical protein
VLVLLGLLQVVRFMGTVGLVKYEDLLDRPRVAIQSGPAHHQGASRLQRLFSLQGG